MWTGERDQGWLAPCRHAEGRLALHAPELPGTGRPMFLNPHPVRQRRAMALMLCDICAKPLRNRTKHLLSPGRYVVVGDRALRGYQEPCVCADCLPLARQWCPHVQRLEPWPPPIMRRYKTMCCVLAVAAFAEIAGKGDYPKPAVGYVKLYMPEEAVVAQTRARKVQR